MDETTEGETITTQEAWDMCTHRPIKLHRILSTATTNYGYPFHDGLQRLPKHMHTPVMLYIAFGLSPGSFLTAVMSWDFVSAVAAADATNRRQIYQWIEFVRFGELPGYCHGNVKIVRMWSAMGGLMPLRDAENIQKTMNAAEGN